MTRQMARLWIIVAGLAGGLGVAAGAFAAHGLTDRLPEHTLAAFRRGADYQVFHALLLLAIAWLSDRGVPLANMAGFFISAGILLFCGSLYLLPLTRALPVVVATPLGGTCFLIGWFLVALAGLRLKSSPLD